MPFHNGTVRDVVDKRGARQRISRLSSTGTLDLSRASAPEPVLSHSLPVVDSTQTFGTTMESTKGSKFAGKKKSGVVPARRFLRGASSAVAAEKEEPDEIKV